MLPLLKFVDIILIRKFVDIMGLLPFIRAQICIHGIYIFASLF